MTRSRIVIEIARDDRLLGVSRMPFSSPSAAAFMIAISRTFTLVSVPDGEIDDETRSSVGTRTAKPSSCR